MTFIATAIVGGAVIGGVASYATGKAASKEARRGAEAGAAATLAATELQIEELRRQFDYQATVLYPRLQQQYAASGAFHDLLGIGANNTVGSPNFNAQATGQIVGSNGQPAVSGSGVPVSTSGFRGSVQAGGPGGQVPGRQMIAPGQAPGFRTDQYGNYIDQQGRSIDPNQSGWITPQQQQELDSINAERAAAGQPQITPFDYGVQMGNIGPDVAGGGRDGMVNLTPEGIQAGIPTPMPPPRGSTPFARGDTGYFVDPNVDPLRLEEEQRLEGQVRNTLLAGTPFEEDVYARNVAENQLRADYGERMLYDPTTGSRRMDFAETNQIFGPTFEESPGYNFMIEEMQREQDRRRSVGGQTLGARAQLELARRTQGMAAGEFYNWAAGRDRDLQRMERAFDEDFQREATDVARMDEAARIDIGRGDVAMENYLGRRAGDVARLDAAVGEADRLRGVDLQRRDAAYQNYLANLRAASGFGDVSGQVVQASQATGGAVAGAYGSQGSQLAGIYNTLGGRQANIATQMGTNISNAVQTGVGNYLFYDYMNRNPVGMSQPGQLGLPMGSGNQFAGYA